MADSQGRKQDEHLPIDQCPLGGYSLGIDSEYALQSNQIAIGLDPEEGEESMTIEIESNELRVQIESLGAELKSIRRKDEPSTEYLWQGSKESWSGRAPLLFPIVGSLPDDTYTHEGRTYRMSSHGFARRSEFDLALHAGNFALFTLASSDETRAQYPFDFTLMISYRLDGKDLIVSYTVENSSEVPMLFSIGAHPGFCCPLEEGLEFEDYSLRYERSENSTRRMKESLLTGKREPLFHNQKTLSLSHELFSRGALIFDDLKSKEVSLESEKGKRRVSMTFEGFPYFGIWSYPHSPQPFVCLEPWYGIDSTEGDSGELAQKEGMLSLESEQQFKATYTIRIE